MKSMEWQQVEPHGREKLVHVATASLLLMSVTLTSSRTPTKEKTKLYPLCGLDLAGCSF
jgi:hypothetical protein